jgi:hypothetical protein
MKDIKQALRNGERIEVQYFDDTIVYVQKVRGGLMLPTAQSPAYFCILGQLLDRNSKFKHPCILLSETEADLPEQFYKKLSNEARKLLCWSFFCDYTDSNYEFRVSLSKYLRKRDLNRVSIKFPYIGDWVNGVLTIRQYSKDGALEIPKAPSWAVNLDKWRPRTNRNLKGVDFMPLMPSGASWAALSDRRGVGPRRRNPDSFSGSPFSQRSFKTNIGSSLKFKSVV